MTVQQSEENKGRSQSNGDHHPTRLRNLLAALSFESRPSLLKKTKSKKQKSKRRGLTQLRSERRRSSTNVLVHAKVDSESSDVFFDAAEYGDLATNEFAQSFHRESVVLPNIVVAHRKGEFETVLQRGNGASESHRSSSEESEDDDDDDDGYSYYPTGLHEPEEDAVTRETSISSSTTGSNGPPPPPPPPPKELPLRFLRAGKGDPAEGLRRYEETLAWRKKEKIDTILREASPQFDVIKEHYPHFCHRLGRQGEPCFYEQPPKTNLKAMREGGVTLQSLLRHYIFVTEFQWQYLIRDDLTTSIYVIDLEGIRFGDFVGEVVDFVKQASQLSAQHYPERAGFVFVINVPVWFKVIWNVIKPIVDDATLHKIYILRGKDEIRKNMEEHIPLENIPPEYGGTSMPLGESPEEKTLAELVVHNNDLEERGERVCGKPSCKFCTWVPPRSY